MKFAIGLVMLAAVGLSACGNKDFDNGFNTTWNKKNHDSCVQAATGKGAPAAAAEQYCSCVIAQLDKLSVQEKMSLDPNSPVATNAVNYCNAQLGAGQPATGTETAPATNAP